MKNKRSTVLRDSQPINLVLLSSLLKDLGIITCNESKVLKTTSYQFLEKFSSSNVDTRGRKWVLFRLK